MNWEKRRDSPKKKIRNGENISCHSARTAVACAAKTSRPITKLVNFSTHLRFSILPGVLGGSRTVKEGALPMAPAVAAAAEREALPDMFSLPSSADPAPEEGLVDLLTGLAPGEASAAKREAFIVARCDRVFWLVNSSVGSRLSVGASAPAESGGHANLGSTPLSPRGPDGVRAGYTLHDTPVRLLGLSLIHI